MKIVFTATLLVASLFTKGQTNESDSLRNALRSEARWSITHENYSKGEKILDNLISDEPNNSENYFSKAMIYYFQKKTDSLTICLEKALELGKDTMRVYREYYRYYSFKLQNYNMCLIYMNKMIDIQPNNGRLYKERSSLFIDLNDYNSSYKDLEKAASLGDEEAKKGLEYIIKTTKRLKEKGLIK